MSSTNLQMRKLRYKQAKSTARKELGQEYQTQIHVPKTQLFEPANQEGGGEMRPANCTEILKYPRMPPHIHTK